MSKYLIRVARAHDLGAVRDIYRRSALSNDGDRSNLLANPDLLVFSDVSIQEQRTRVAVGYGQIIGFATTRTDHDVVELEDLFVDPEWTRRGVASELIDDLVTTAKARRSTRVEVTANSHALGFYRAAGFVVDGSAETRFGRASRMHIDLAL